MPQVQLSHLIPEVGGRGDPVHGLVRVYDLGVWLQDSYDGLRLSQGALHCVGDSPP